ncbi:MAG: putative secreted protein [Acidobacteriaceae bacterium]|jgi:hypothetical protein|nr:putative secreted protein [Acidobacteriaceae bacterium]
MDTRMLVAVVLIGVVALLLVTAVVMILRRRKSEQLKQRFGTEYDRAVQEQGDPRLAEAVLEERTKRVETFSLHSLSPADREAYAIEWAAVQRRFVDDPGAAVGSADRLVSRVMTDRGYPMTNFVQRADDISVSYPAVVQNYRAAHDIHLKNEEGAATTEELRRAMVHYRSLFDEVLEKGTVTTMERKKTGVAHGRAS